MEEIAGAYSEAVGESGREFLNHAPAQFFHHRGTEVWYRRLIPCAQAASPNLHESRERTFFLHDGWVFTQFSITFRRIYAQASTRLGPLSAIVCRCGNQESDWRGIGDLPQ